MDLKAYEKTRYQNIYRHKKNKNYVIVISKPVKSSIASINGEKIYKIEDALKIRDNQKIKIQKGAEVSCKGSFDTLWDKYMKHCQLELKLAYNSIIRKQKTYNKYLKGQFKKNITKLKKSDIVSFIAKQNCSDKQKNQILKELKAFFNYLIKEEEVLIISPTTGIKKYKVEKTEMKYWIPSQLHTFLTYINKNLNSDIPMQEKFWLYTIKILTIITFTLGDRIGETRALNFKCFDRAKGLIRLKHSISYDTTSKDFLSTTKTYHSQRNVDVTDKIFDEIELYKQFLIHEMKYKIDDTTLLFFNHERKRPFTDTTLRKHFHMICDDVKVPRIRMYDLRHTYVATMMAEGKELYQISPRIGHSSYAITVDKYGHLSREIRKEIAEVTDKYI